LDKEDPPTTEANKGLIISFFRNILLRYIDKFTRVYDDTHLNKKKVVIVGDFNKKLEDDSNRVITKLLDAHKQFIKTSYIDNIYLDHILVKSDPPLPETEVESDDVGESGASGASASSVSIWKPYTISRADASSRWGKSAPTTASSEERFSFGRDASGTSAARFSFGKAAPPRGATVATGATASVATGSYGKQLSALGLGPPAPKIYKFRVGDKVKKKINGTEYIGKIMGLTTYYNEETQLDLNCYRVFYDEDKKMHDTGLRNELLPRTNTDETLELVGGSFREKYLKYKQKYLQLKSLI